MVPKPVRLLQLELMCAKIISTIQTHNKLTIKATLLECKLVQPIRVPFVDI